MLHVTIYTKNDLADKHQRISVEVWSNFILRGLVHKEPDESLTRYSTWCCVLTRWDRPDKNVSSALRKQTLMSTLLGLTVYSQGSGLVRLHHLGGSLLYYLCTSWQELLRVCMWARLAWAEDRALAHTAREWGPLKGDRASVWRLKIEWRVCEMTAARRTVCRAFVRKRVWGGGFRCMQRLTEMCSIKKSQKMQFLPPHTCIAWTQIHVVIANFTH